MRPAIQRVAVMTHKLFERNRKENAKVAKYDAICRNEAMHDELFYRILHLPSLPMI